MEMSEVLLKVKSFDWKKHQTRLRELVQKKPLLVGASVLFVLLIVNLIGMGSGQKGRIFERPSEVSFQNGRILNDRESTFYYGKEKLLSQKAQALIDTQSKLETRLSELEKKLAQGNATSAVTTQGATTDGSAQQAGNPNGPTADPAIQLYPPGDVPVGGTVTRIGAGQKGRASSGRAVLLNGPDLIAFPVKGEQKTEGVMLPAGSYVKAKILTGVEVPEGKTYPVLMVLDFSYVAPNDHKVDLSGCFMIAKAEGDLSTERVQMQATKMSCVSKRGKMFEREVNGFVADDKDGSFAMQGKVNSKQGRVATMAFLASVVDGVGKAVQAAQTTQTT